MQRRGRGHSGGGGHGGSDGTAWDGAVAWSPDEEVGEEVERELLELLVPQLEPYSRQRLRCLAWALQRHAEARDGVLTSDVLTSCLQECQLALSERAVRMLAERFRCRDPHAHGISSRPLGAFLQQAQLRTGRDSVRAALRARAQRAPGCRDARDAPDRALLASLGDALLRHSPPHFQPEELREILVERARGRRIIARGEMITSCREARLPVHGPLLGRLMARCSQQERGAGIRWPDFLEFLSEALQSDATEVPAETAQPGSALLPAPTNTTTPAPGSSATPAPSSDAPSSATTPAPAATSSDERSAMPPPEARSGAMARQAGPPRLDRPPMPTDAASDERGATVRSSPQISAGARARASVKASTEERCAVATAPGRVARTADTLARRVQPSVGDDGGSDSSNVVAGAWPGTERQMEQLQAPARVPEVTAQSGADVTFEPMPLGSKVTVSDVGSASEQQAVPPSSSSKTRLPPSRQGELQPPKAPTKTTRGFFSALRAALSGASKDPMDAPGGGSSRGLGPDGPNAAAPLPSRPLGAKDETLDFSRTESVAVTVNGKALTYRVDERHRRVAAFSGDPPASAPVLEWVYGHSGRDCQGGLVLTGDAELVYPVGLLVVVLNPERRTQSIYSEHTAHITSMALHPDKRTMATAQGDKSSAVDDEEREDKPDAGRPRSAHVRLWRSDSLQTLLVLGAGLLGPGPVISLDFNGAATAAPPLLLAAGGGPAHVLLVWELGAEHRRLLSATLGQHESQLRLACVRFSRREPNSVVSGGRQHLAWWRLQPEEGTVHLETRANYGAHFLPRAVTCMAFSSRGELLTGDSNGTVFVWAEGGGAVSQLIQHAHDAPLLALLPLRGALLTAARDHSVSAWSWGRTFQHAGTLQIPECEGGAVALAMSGGGGRGVLYLATLGCSVLWAPLGGSDDAAAGASLAGVALGHPAVTHGHRRPQRAARTKTTSVAQRPKGASREPEEREEEEAWAALGIHRGLAGEGLFVTAGRDGLLQLCDSKERSCLLRHAMPGAAFACVDVGPAGWLIDQGILPEDLGGGGADDDRSARHGTPEHLVAAATDDATVALLCVGGGRGGGRPPWARVLCRVPCVAPASATALRLSPTGRHVALACADDAVYVLLVGRPPAAPRVRRHDKRPAPPASPRASEDDGDALVGLSVAAVCRTGCPGPITGLDWSREPARGGQHLLRASTGQGGDATVWDTASGERLAYAAAWGNAAWDSDTCTGGFAKMGALQAGAPAACDVSPDGALLMWTATLPAPRSLLFRHPCVRPGAGWRAVPVAGAHAARFERSGRALVTVAANVAQWRLAPSPAAAVATAEVNGAGHDEEWTWGRLRHSRAAGLSCGMQGARS
ncbi:uncharacterized protein LOC144945949 [Lampetra fluviatilis]